MSFALISHRIIDISVANIISMQRSTSDRPMAIRRSAVQTSAWIITYYLDLGFYTTFLVFESKIPKQGRLLFQSVPSKLNYLQFVAYEKQAINMAKAHGFQFEKVELHCMQNKEREQLLSSRLFLKKPAETAQKIDQDNAKTRFVLREEPEEISAKNALVQLLTLFFLF